MCERSSILKDLNQKLPDFFLPDYLEELVTFDEQEEKKDEQMMVRAGSVLVNCEDFGGSLALPHYGLNMPPKDTQATFYNYDSNSFRKN